MKVFNKRYNVMKTKVARKEDFTPESRQWYHIDAEGAVLGRLAAVAACKLMGKDRADYTPHVDTGAYVVVTNAAKVTLTGKKKEKKTYQSYSGYPGGLKTRTIHELLEKRPEDVIIHAVKGMLPRGPLGRQMLRKLKVYAGPEHPHTYHKPETVSAGK